LVSTGTSAKFSGKEAAGRYASDDAFARDFDRALAELFKEQLARLERIGKKLGQASEGVSGSMAQAGRPPKGSLAPAQVVAVLTEAGNPLTRGEIALRLGVDSREGSLTRILKFAKEHGLLRQQGERRAARYSLPAGARRR